ncbi:MAG: 3-dehydroquinate dehydratase [Bacteroidales bacterium]|nr:3-dehydroquinate dehydratase [Bacteroidales bacterium]
MKVFIINGVNLGQLGSREVDIYGHRSFEDYLRELVNQYPEVDIDYLQEEEEGLLAKAIAEARDYSGIILNPGAYTHTSIALADAIRTTPCPVIEVHISNIFNRETFRQQDLIAAHCSGSICGFGLDSYRLALEHIIKKKEDR